MSNNFKTFLRLFFGILSVFLTTILIIVLFSEVIKVHNPRSLEWYPLLIAFIGFYVAGLINRKTKLALLPVLLLALIIFIPLKQIYYPFFFLVILFSSLSLLISRRMLNNKYKIPSVLFLIVVFGLYLFSEPLIIEKKGFGYNDHEDLFNATVLWDFSNNKPSILPNETFLDINKNKVHLKEFKGKKMYVTFWATWCGPCLGQKPELEAIKKHFQTDTNVVFVDISIDSNLQRWKEYILKHKPTGVQLLSRIEGLTRSNFKFSSIPFHLVANSEGYFKSNPGPYYFDFGLLSNTDSLTEYINTPYKVFNKMEVNEKDTFIRVR